MRSRFIGLMLCVMMTLIPLASAQDSSPVIAPASDAMVNPEANISFPPPVYAVRGGVEIRGTVNLANMRSFFIQFRQLVLDDEDMADAPWFPATIQQTQTVDDGVLGIWNTLIAPDGVYELRLTINTDGEEPEYVRVSPIRVDNETTHEADMDMEAETEMAAAEEDASPSEEVASSAEDTEAPDEADATPTPEDTTPRATALTDSNVRSGDSTAHHRVGFLLTGQSAKIIGISSRNTGWFYIEMENGHTGFIFPGIVSTSGDISNLERITPPPPPPPPPTAVPVVVQPAAPAPAPAGNANIGLENVVISPHPLVCQQTATIVLTVKNNGADSPGGMIQVRDTRQGSNELGGQTSIGFPPLKRGESIRIGAGKLTVSTYYNEMHNINFYIDNRLVHAAAAYPLQKGNC